MNDIYIMEEKSMLQSFLIGNVLGLTTYSMIELYKYYTGNTKDNTLDNYKEKINIQNEKILSLKNMINIQLEEIEDKAKFIKEQSEIIDEQSIELEKKNKIIIDLRSKHKKVRDKIVIEYED